MPILKQVWPVRFRWISASRGEKKLLLQALQPNTASNGCFVNRERPGVPWFEVDCSIQALDCSTLGADGWTAGALKIVAVSQGRLLRLRRQADTLAYLDCEGRFELASRSRDARLDSAASRFATVSWPTRLPLLVEDSRFKCSLIVWACIVVLSGKEWTHRAQ